MRKWIVYYTAFRGTKYANSGQYVVQDANSIESAIKKTKQQLKLSSTDIDKVEHY